MINSIVTVTIFTIYAIILSIFLSNNVKLARLTVAVGIAFGTFSYASVTALNSVETYIMNTRGSFHVLLIGPIQEEITKFTFFLLAYFFIMRKAQEQHLDDENLSELKGTRNLVILSAFIGLTLATFETLIDYRYLTVELTLLRTVISWPLHIITVGLSAYGFSKYLITQRHVMILCLLLAILIHILYNTIIVSL